MVFRIGMHGDMAFVQMRHDGIRLGRGLHMLLRDQEGDGGALRVVILFGDMQHMRADHLGHALQNAGQPLGVVLLVDVGDIVALLALGFGIAYVVNVERQRLGQVVEPVQFQLVLHTGNPHN